MLKLPITYTNLFTEEEETLTCYFNLSKIEVLEMNVGGFAAMMQQIVATEDHKSLVEQFKRLILSAYGKRDGDFFRKSPEASEEFAQHPAFEELFMKMATDADFAGDFIIGIVPKDMREEAASQMKQMKRAEAAEPPQLGETV